MCFYDRMASPRPTLDGFRQYLSLRGLTDGTIDVYVRDMSTAKATEGGVLARLRDEELAPKTKRHILAAARHWAEYAKDERLPVALKNLRLPPARRKKAKVPMTRDQLLDLVDAIPGATYLDAPTRAVIGLMAGRGLRIGDCLRITRGQVQRALSEGVLSFQAKGRKYLEFKVSRNFKPYLQMLAGEDDWERVDELVAPGAAEATRRAAAARSVERALVRMGAKLSIWGLHPHRLRRTYAVEYLRQLRGDPEALVKLTQHMQWASMATALEYVDHARGEELDGAAEKIFER